MTEIIDLFVGKHVLVEIADCRVPGRLLHHEFGSRTKPHRPELLILETAFGKAIVRGDWNAIGTFTRQTKNTEKHIQT